MSPTFAAPKLCSALAAAMALGATTVARPVNGRGQEPPRHMAPGRTKVVMLGTGTPVIDPDRFGPATVVVVDSTPYLFDFGVGVLRRWGAAIQRGIVSRPPWALKTAFVTHLHSDHTLGYAELIFSSWTLEPAANRRPLEVYGPRGLRDMTTNILRAYAEDVRLRTGPGAELVGSRPPVVHAHEVEPGVVYRDSLVTVTAFPVRHGTWSQAFGYRVQTPDRVIVLSGDAAPSPIIAEQCAGCDILIHEGGRFDFDSLGIAGAKRGQYNKDFHTSAQELSVIAAAAKPKLLVLYHQVPGEDTLGVQLLRTRLGARVVRAKDLDVFE